MIFRNILTCALALAGALSVIVSALGQQEAERQVQRDAAIGQTVRVRGHVNYSHNCSDVVPTAIAVIQAPRARNACNKRRNCFVRPMRSSEAAASAAAAWEKPCITPVSMRAPMRSTTTLTSLNGVVHVHVAIGSAGISGPTVADFQPTLPALPDAGSAAWRRADAHCACARAGAGVRSELPDMDRRRGQDHARDRRKNCAW